MSSFIDSVEGQTSIGLVFTKATILSEVQASKLGLILPVQFVGPLLSTKPVALVVKITRVDENGEVLAQNIGNISRLRLNFILVKMLIDSVIAFTPASVLDLEGFSNIISIHKVINSSHIVAEGTITLLLNVVDIELGWVASDLSGETITVSKSLAGGRELDELLANKELGSQFSVQLFINKLHSFIYLSI